MTHSFIEAYKEARTRLEDQLAHIRKEDLAKKLHPSPNSLGFLLRHIDTFRKKCIQSFRNSNSGKNDH